MDGGRKSDTPGSVEDAKSRLRMKEIVGIPNKGKEGLGMNPRKYYSSSTKEERRTMVVDTIREAEEERRSEDGKLDQTRNSLQMGGTREEIES